MEDEVYFCIKCRKYRSDSYCLCESSTESDIICIDPVVSFLNMMENIKVQVELVNKNLEILSEQLKDNKTNKTIREIKE